MTFDPIDLAFGRRFGYVFAVAGGFASVVLCGVPTWSVEAFA